MRDMMMRMMMGAAAAGMLALAAVPAWAQDHVKTAAYQFDYAAPAAANRHPALRNWLAADARTLRTKLARDTAAARREAATSGYPYHAWSIEKTWKVVTDTPRFLSLSYDSYTYTGGAHGSPKSGSLLWDKAAKRRMATREVFTSAAAVETALRTGFCRQLNVERAKKRGAPVKPGTNPFNQCPKVSETTLLLGSTDRRRIDRIGLIADPYVAGAYAEGSYEVTLPVTPALLRAVKPAYRSAFAAR